MIKAKAVQTSHKGEVYPGVQGTIVQCILVDESTNQSLTDKQVRAAFAKFEITGVYVVLKYDPSRNSLAGPPDAPVIAIITEITPETIYLGNYAVPRSKFQDWYELD